MANLKNIRTQIKSVTSIQKVTKAMKMVAAAKLRKSQENMEKARPYSERIKKLIANLINDIDSSFLPLLNPFTFTYAYLIHYCIYVVVPMV